MRLALVLLFLVLLAPATKAEDLYDFVTRCKADPVSACFGRIRVTVDQVRDQEQGRSICLPRVWYPAPAASQSYPVSLLDYILLRLSAARVTRPGDPFPAVLRDLLAGMYPCRDARR
jgi:hypothetical protein